MWQGYAAATAAAYAKDLLGVIRAAEFSSLSTSDVPDSIQANPKVSSSIG